METVERACYTSELLGGELPKFLGQPDETAGVGLDQPEFDRLVGFQLRRLLQDHPRLRSSAEKARSAPADSKVWCSLRTQMERALRGDPAKLDALWALLQAAGQPPRKHEEPVGDPPKQHRGRLRRGVAGVLTRMGAVVAVALMAALGGVALLAADTDSAPTVLRWFAVIVLASLPGWLFLRFIVFRAGSLWTEYVLNLHRLGMDEHHNLPRPPMGSSYHELWTTGGGSVLAASPNIYQQKFEAYYGKFVGPEADRRKPVVDKTIPQVLLATAVLAVGWTAVLARDPLLSGDLRLPVDALRFGFMGAYVFVLQMLIRRFFQSDLKASAYLGAVARIITVLVIVLVVHYAAPMIGSLDPGTEVGLAFLIGFFPLLGMQIVQKAVSVAFRRFVHTLKTPYPLSDLDGLNIWYEARLLEEGIEDMQNLVTGNLVDIILHTRVPVGRLVDWIDQAALQLLLDPPEDRKGNHRPNADRNKLRRLGIRTATDLETAFLSPERLARRASWPSVCNIEDRNLVTGLRTVLNDSTMPNLNVTEALLKSFCNSPNLVHVRHWRDILCTEHEKAVPAEPGPSAAQEEPPEAKVA